MLVTTVNLPDGKPVFLLEQFFPADKLALLHQICDNFDKDSKYWTHPEGFNNSRWVHTGTEKEYQLIVEYLSSPELMNKLSELIGHPVHLSNHTLWLDVTGLGPLRPHREAGGEFLAQIFITRQFDNFNGTTFYSNDRNVLFQLPYRNNFGWLFKGTEVLHGRQFDVAPGLERFSIMMWYNTTL